MKKILLVPLLLAAISLSGCSKDDERTGKLHVSFDNSSGVKITIHISPAENSSIRVYEKENVVEGATFEMNAGNYIITSYAYGGTPYYGSTGFQIKPGKNTYINYTSGGVAVVSY